MLFEEMQEELMKIYEAEREAIQTLKECMK